MTKSKSTSPHQATHVRSVVISSIMGSKDEKKSRQTDRQTHTKKAIVIIGPVLLFRLSPGEIEFFGGISRNFLKGTRRPKNGCRLHFLEFAPNNYHFQWDISSTQAQQVADRLPHPRLMILVDLILHLPFLSCFFLFFIIFFYTRVPCAPTDSRRRQ